MQLTTRAIGYIFLGLTLATAGLEWQMMQSSGTHHHEMAPSHYLMVLAPAAVTVAWPLANGWRPWQTKADDLSCTSCGTEWLPGEAAGACPACGEGKPAVAA